MATRTVRDCDRCGAKDIQDAPISKHLSSGTLVDIDLCASCKNAVFPIVFRQLGDQGVIAVRNSVAIHRQSVAHHHGATPDDMRP